MRHIQPEEDLRRVGPVSGARDWVSAEKLFACWEHYLLNPLVGISVDPATWPGRLFGMAVKGQMHLKDTTIFRLEKRVIGSQGMSEGDEFQAF